MSRFVLWLMTFATGVTVANLYYCQPLLHQMSDSLQASPAEIGWIATLTQLGYAAGMLLLIPLGDRYERRGMILLATVVSAIALFGVSVSQNLLSAAILSFFVGFSTMTPQLIIPFAAHLAPPAERGRILGTVFSGLLLGILLARAVSGFVGAAFGWRAMFAIAAGALILLTMVLARTLPKSEPTFHGTYTELLKSVFELVRSQPILRESMLYGAMLFGSFSAFWATLIYLMESETFHLGARAVGLFGLIGAAGALAAPLFGKMTDRRDPKLTIGLGIVTVIVAFVVYWIGVSSLIALAIGVLLMDVGVQAGHVANQSRIFALNPEARSRIQTAYMFAYFCGGAFGSLVASAAWEHFGWAGVCSTSLVLLFIAGVRFLISQTSKKLSQAAS